MLILLDIDGVMVPAKSWTVPEILEDNFAAFNSRATQALQKIISETNAIIVLTTSHKSNHTLSEWQNIFITRGIDVKNIERLPDNKANLSRKEEILNWYKFNISQEHFVIIDDDKSLNELPNFLKQKLVLTSPLIGLTNYLATEAISILEREEEEEQELRKGIQKLVSDNKSFDFINYEENLYTLSNLKR